MTINRTPSRINTRFAGFMGLQKSLFLGQVYPKVYLFELGRSYSFEGSHKELTTARLAVIPPKLDSSWERSFVDLLDRDQHGIVLWWHRNPKQTPYSVSVLLPTGRAFYPDFVIGVHGRKTELNALLADPKQQFDTYKEVPKSDAVHSVYPAKYFDALQRAKPL